MGTHKKIVVLFTLLALILFVGFEAEAGRPFYITDFMFFGVAGDTWPFGDPNSNIVDYKIRIGCGYPGDPNEMGGAGWKYEKVKVGVEPETYTDCTVNLEKDTFTINRYFLGVDLGEDSSGNAVAVDLPIRLATDRLYDIPKSKYALHFDVQYRLGSAYGYDTLLTIVVVDKDNPEIDSCTHNEHNINERRVPYRISVASEFVPNLGEIRRFEYPDTGSCSPYFENYQLIDFTKTWEDPCP